MCEHIVLVATLDSHVHRRRRNSRVQGVQEGLQGVQAWTPLLEVCPVAAATRVEVA